MIKMTGRTVLVAGQTVLVAGTWSEVGAHSALPAEGPDTTAIRLPFHRPVSDADSTRPGPAAVEDREHFRPGPPACTKAPVPAAPRGRDHPGGAATTTDLLAASSHPHQEAW